MTFELLQQDLIRVHSCVGDDSKILKSHGVAIGLQVVHEIDKLSVDIGAGAGVGGLGEDDICIGRSAVALTMGRQAKQKRRAGLWPFLLLWGLAVSCGRRGRLRKLRWRWLRVPGSVILLVKCAFKRGSVASQARHGGEREKRGGGRRRREGTTTSRLKRSVPGRAVAVPGVGESFTSSGACFVRERSLG